MKGKGYLFLLMVIVCTVHSNSADAQFFKKLFGRKEPKRSTPVRKPKPVTTDKPAATKPIVKKPKVEEYPATVKKDRYRIDVFAPLYLDELIKDNKSVHKGRLPDKAINGLDFYSGVKLAVDTLNHMGYSIDLYMHDVTQASGSPDNLISKKVLDSSDLLIGAVHNTHIPTLAGFAKKHNINFVSAYSPSDAGVKNNPYFIQMQPSLQSHCNWIMNTVDKKYKHRTPIVMYRTNVKLDSTALGYLNLDENDAKLLPCNSIPTRERLQRTLDSDVINVIIMPIMNATEAEKILLKLNEWFPAYQLEVYGMPSWRSMPSLKKPDAYPNIAVYITSPFYFDISTGPGQAVSKNYKQDVGGNRPGDMVFRGYETTYWYSYLLTKYGTIFNGMFNDNAAAPFTRFEIKTKKDKEDKLMYQENTHIYLYRYQSSSYMVEQ